MANGKKKQPAWKAKGYSSASAYHTSDEYKKKIRKLPKRADIERLYEIFNQDTSIVEEHIDQLLTTGESTVFNDLKKVKPGYARNYLIPKGLAIVANPANKKVLQEALKRLPMI